MGPFGLNHGLPPWRRRPLRIDFFSRPAWVFDINYHTDQEISEAKVSSGLGGLQGHCDVDSSHSGITCPVWESLLNHASGLFKPSEESWATIARGTRRFREQSGEMRRSPSPILRFSPRPPAPILHRVEPSRAGALPDNCWEPGIPFIGDCQP